MMVSVIVLLKLESIFGTIAVDIAQTMYIAKLHSRLGHRERIVDLGGSG